MFDKEFILLALGMSLVTYLPRWFPLFALSGRKLPGWFKQWLDVIPVAIIAALLAPLLLVSESTGQVELLKPELLVAIPTAIFAFKFRSLGGTIIIGMLLFWLLGKLL
jgi:branched-subunit amino acid transport protein